MEAVKNDGEVLELVETQTEDICIDAVEQTWKAFELVKEKTDRIFIIIFNQRNPLPEGLGRHPSSLARSSRPL